MEYRPPHYSETHPHRIYSFINFASSTPEQLDQLAAACDPATFGRGKQDVYDESYRKALKMDATNFAVQFDPAASGLIKTIQSNLFRRQMEDMSIVPQIYKLNVYGRPLRPPPLVIKIDTS